MATELHDLSIADLERRLAGFDHEDLRIGMPMELRSDAGLGVDEDHRERHLPVVGADELVGVLGVGKVAELHAADRQGHRAGCGE